MSSSQVCPIQLRVPKAFSPLRYLPVRVDAGAEWFCGTRRAGQPNSQGRWTGFVNTGRLIGTHLSAGIKHIVGV
jgi:hypothetical protein